MITLQDKRKAAATFDPKEEAHKMLIEVGVKARSIVWLTKELTKSDPPILTMEVFERLSAEMFIDGNAATVEIAQLLLIEVCNTMQVGIEMQIRNLLNLPHRTLKTPGTPVKRPTFLKALPNETILSDLSAERLLCLLRYYVYRDHSLSLALSGYVVNYELKGDPQPDGLTLWHIPLRMQCLRKYTANL